MESLHLRWRIIGEKNVAQILCATHFAAVHKTTHDLNQVYYCAMTDDHALQLCAGRARENYE
jgi:hypothetical protein